ncbi:MAG TPA: hypothetical protein VLG93_02765 [Sulfuricaulis sp.]|nr:hypothetical protein [Sulfuricaulis sp.]
MASIKPFQSTRCLDCRHVDESARQAVSWMRRSRPGIKWQAPARAETNRPGSGLASLQPHHSSQGENHDQH